MPGITGIISPDKSLGQAHKSALDKMVRVMRHDPSYISGSYVDEEAGVYVGWTALANSFSDCMPIWNEAKSILLLFDGEVYADDSELVRLRTKHQCSTGNADYVVHLYEERGAEAIAELNGFFSGLLLDVRRREAVLFNDRFGMQRLYYCLDNGSFLFASEAKALLVARPSFRQLDLQSLAELFALGCVLDGRSLFKGIHQLEGASLVTFRHGTRTGRQTYFDRRTWEEQEKLRPDEFFEELQATLHRVIPRYFAGRLPVGMSLTGGLDTRLILAYGQALCRALPCYTFASTYRDTFDVRVAREVAAVYGQQYSTIAVGADFLQRYPELAEAAVFISDGNYGVTGAASLYTNRLARQIAPIRMTGNYGSEVLRGYGEFRPKTLDLAMFSPEFRGQCQEAASRYREVRLSHGVSFAAFRQAPWFNYNRLTIEQSQMGIRTPYMDNELVALMYRAPYIKEADNTTSFELIRRANMRLAEICTDRGETMNPRGLPAILRTRYRWLLKRGELGFDYCMPQWFARVYRFVSPVHLDKCFLGRFSYLHFRGWFRHELSGYLREMLLDNRTLQRGILDGPAVRRAVVEHTSGRGNHTLTLQGLLSYELIERRLLCGTDQGVGGTTASPLRQAS